MKKFNEITDKNPFKVPDSYFEEVNRKIISATCGKNRDVKKIGFYNRFRPYLLAAASVAGFIVLSYTAVKLLIPDTKNSLGSKELSGEYPELYIYDIDILTIEENAASLDLPGEGYEVNNTAIIDYLLLENIEINDIYEKL